MFMRVTLAAYCLWSCLAAAALGQEMARPATAGGAAAPASAAGSFSPVRFEGAADATGALVQRIDVSVPPFHGLAPRLALTYHSRGGDGPLGVGWSLAGLSAVQRASPGKGIARFDRASDVHLLDGELLHACVAGTPSPSCRYPAPAGSHVPYFTDIERYRRVGYAAAGDAWTVWLQDGTRLDYGERLLTATGETAAWLLSAATDSSGNRVVYAYTAAAPGQARLVAGIRYGATEIVFHYARRPYARSYGIGGATVVADERLLTTIDERVDGRRLRAYALDYAGSPATGRSLLASVQEFGRDAQLDAAGAVDRARSPSSLPPTSLRYLGDDGGGEPSALRAETFPASDGTTVGFAQDRGEARLTVRAEALTASAVRHLAVDLNGDGLTDHVVMLYDPNAKLSDTAGAYPATFQAFLSRPGGSLKRLEPFTHPIVNPANDLFQLQLADVDGDHRLEILALEPRQTPAPHYATVTLFFDAVAQVFTHAAADRALAGVRPSVRFAESLDARDRPVVTAIAWGAQVLSGDMNGDGYADVALANVEGPDRRYVVHVALGRGDGSFEALAPWTTDRQASVDARWLSGDLNGDGRVDLVFLGPEVDDGDPEAPHAPEGARLVLCGALSSTALDPAFRVAPFVLTCEITTMPALRKDERCLVNDPLFPRPLPSFFFAARDGFVMADVNGDGSQDLVRVGADLDADTCNARPFPRDSTYQTYQPALSNGDGSFNVSAEHAPRLARGSTVLVADIEGDGRDDLFALRPVVDGTACDPGAPPGTDCGIQASVIQVRFKGVRGSSDVSADARSTAPGLVFPYGGFQFGGAGALQRTLDTVEAGDFDGDGRAEISVWHRAHDRDRFLDDFGWLDETRTRPCAAAACPFYDVLLRARTWQPGAEPIDAGRFRPADVDGDGYPDYVKAEVAGSRLKLFVRLRRPDGTFASLAPAAFLTPLGLGPDALRVADVNADGRADLVAARYDEPVAPGRPPLLRVLTLLAAGGGAFSGGVFTLEVPRRMPDQAHWFAADTDGDGAAELVYISPTPSSDQQCRRHVRLDVFRWSEGFEVDPASGTRRPVSVWTPLPPAELPACGAGRNSPDWHVYDADRNGTQDFVGAWARPGPAPISYAVVSLLAGRDGSFRAVDASVASSFVHAPGRWTPIDLNGDGLPELGTVVNEIAPGRARILARVLLSSGDGAVTVTPAYDEGGLPVERARHFVFLEWNGDGRTDLARVWFERRGAGRDLLAQPLVSDGRAFVSGAPVSRFAGAVPYPDLGRLRALTVDGGPRQALEYVGTGWPAPETLVRTFSWYAAPRMAADLLGLVEAPFGAVTTASYARMTDAARTSEPASGCRLPPNPGYLVSKLGVAPRGDALTEEIRYECPRYSPAERSLWAWRAIERVEAPLLSRPARTVVENWDADDQCGARLRSSLVSGGGSRRETTFTLRPPGPAAPYRCETTNVVVADTDPSGTLTRGESFTYGELGGVEERRESGDAALAGDERTTRLSYQIAADPFIVTLATREVRAGSGAAGPLLVQDEFCYDGGLCAHRATSRGLLTAERRFHDVPGRFVTLRQIGYDARGNLTSLTDAEGHTTTVDYDPAFGLYPETVRNAAGHATRIEWDAVLGQPSALVDPNGARETRAYDPLGRLTSVATADGGRTTFDYRAWGLAAQGVRTTVADGSPSGLWSERRFDGLGRTTSIRRKASEAGPAYVFDFRYGDLSNGPREASHGFLDGAAGVPVETFTYDFLERLASVRHPDGSLRRTPTLARRAGEVDERGHARESTLDAYGNVTAVIEAGTPTLTFERDALGRLERIRDAADNRVELTWDTLGRVVREQDPDLGARTFTYDDVGRLTSVRDARGDVVSLTYDAVGRPNTRAVNGTTIVTWKYDEAGHGFGLGRLTSVLDTRSACAVARRLDYDEQGRAVSETRCWDGSAYTLGRRFDPLGRLARLTYPSAANRAPADGEEFTLTYQANGFPDALPGIVTASVHDPEGRLLSRALANGSSTTHAYDGRREWPLGESVDLPAARLALGYTLDPDAVLTRLSAVGPTRSVEHAYRLDDRHRLALAETTLGASTSAQAFDYDLIGNLRTAAGEGYTYAPFGPAARLVHAAASVAARSLEYDVAGRTVKVARGGSDEQRFEWDAEGALTAVEIWDGAAWKRTEYAYDAAGRRIKVRTPDGKVSYDFFDEVEQDGAGRMVKRYFSGGDLVARRDGAGALTYLYADVSGSIRLVADDAGRVLEELDYDAFGRVLHGDVAGAGGFGFAGGRHDASTTLPGVPGSGLVRLGARAYDPLTRRFVSPDSLLPSLGRAEGLGRYTYAFNSPSQFVDPSGRSPENVVSPGPGPDFTAVGGPRFGGPGGAPAGPVNVVVRQSSPAAARETARRTVEGDPGEPHPLRGEHPFDYYKVSFGLGPLVSGQVIRDRFGRWYGGIGFGFWDAASVRLDGPGRHVANRFSKLAPWTKAGRQAWKKWSLSVTAGAIWDKDYDWTPANAAGIYESLTGDSKGVGGCYFVCGQFSWDDTSISGEVGVGVGAGVNFGGDYSGFLGTDQDLLDAIAPGSGAPAPGGSGDMRDHGPLRNRALDWR